MDNIHLWTLTQEVYQTIVLTYQPVLSRFYAEKELDEGLIRLLFTALAFEPEVISSARLQVFIPYTSASTYQAKLADLVSKDFLTELKPCEYQLSMRGLWELTRLLLEMRTVLAAADPLPLVASQSLTTLLEKLVHACLEANTHPRHGCFALAYKLLPTASPPLPYSEQAISCLAAYRDDAHLAAWQSTNLSAPALETLTLLWWQEADSLDSVFQRLRHRGHPELTYAKAFEKLHHQGFIEGPNEAPSLTDLGRTFRAQLEHATNRYFFTPWACLDLDERSELTELLCWLRDDLQAREGERNERN